MDIQTHPDNQAASNWLENYVDFSRLWSPRAYDGFHVAAGLFVLSTVAGRRVSAHFGKQRFTNMYMALVARTSFFAKSTTTNIALSTIKKAGFSWMLAPDNATPQKFIANLSNCEVDKYDGLDEEQKTWVKLHLATAAQKGWYYEEFGEHIHAMMNSGGFMTDFRSILRRFDDTPDRYEYSTISRGNDVVERVYLTLLANMTPDDLKVYAQKGSALWGDGFLARYALITPPNNDQNRGRFPEGKRVIPEQIIQPLIKWHERLGIPEIGVADVPGKNGTPNGLKRVVFQPVDPSVLLVPSDIHDAYYTYDDYLLDLIKDQESHDLDGNYTRLAEKALRIAMIFASLEGCEQIGHNHWKKAQKITDSWREDLHELYEQINQPSPSKERENEENVIRIVKKFSGSPTAAEVGRLSRNLSSKEAAKILDGLVDVAILVVKGTTNKGTKRYDFNNPDES